jgi:hypothetical protein
MIPLARWRCKIGSHTVQRERSEKATRRKGGRRQPLIQYRSKQALAESSNDTGPASPLPETAALQSKNGSFYGDEANRSQEAGRKPDSARRSSLGSLFTVQVQYKCSTGTQYPGPSSPLVDQSCAGRSTIVEIVGLPLSGPIASNRAVANTIRILVLPYAWKAIIRY